MSSKIPHTRLFDFPAYQQAIKEVKDATIDFGKTIDSVIGRLKKQTQEAAAAMKEYANALKNFNVAQNGAGDALKNYNKQISDTAAEMEEMKAVAQGLAQFHVINAKTIKQVEAEYKGLVNQLKNLKPYQGDYQAQVERIEKRLKEVVPRLDQFKNGLKNTEAIIRSAEGSYKQMQLQLNVLKQRLQSMPGAFDQYTGKINKNNKEAVALQKQIGQLDTALKTADKSMGMYYRNVGNYASAFSDIKSSIAASLGPVALLTSALALAGKTFDQVLDVSQKFQSLNTALKIVSETTGNYAINQQFLLELSTKYGQDIFVLTEAYKGLAAVTRGTNNEGANTRKVFESIIQAGTVLKLSNDQVKGALLAVQQMFSKGNVQAEELRGQLGERLPGAFKIFAEALGVSEQQLNKMLQKGEVLANDALPKFAKRLSEVYGKDAVANAHDLVNETNRLENSINRFLDSKPVVRFWSTMKSAAAGFFENLRFFMKSDQFNLIDFLTPGGQKRIAAANAAEMQKAMQDQKFLTDFEDKNQEERAKILQGAVFKQEQYNKKTASLIDERDRLEAAGQKKEASRLNERVKFYTEIAQKQNQFVDQLTEINERLLNPAKTNNGADDGGKKTLKTLKDKIKDQQDLIKSGYELDVSELELSLAKKEISERTFQEKKLELATKYVNAAIAIELKLGKEADKSKINDFKKFLLEREQELAKFEQKRNKPLPTNIALIDPNADKTRLAGYKVGDNVTKGFKQQAKDIASQFDTLIGGATGAFDILNAGGDASYQQQKEYLEKLAALNEEAANAIGARDVELSKKYSEEAAKAKIAAAELAANKEKQLQEQSQQLIFDALNTGLTIVQDQFNAKFEERLSKLEEEKQKQIDAAGSNASAREAIEKKYNERIAKEKRKQAQTDKAMALFGVAINTAQAVTKTLAFWHMPVALPFIAMAIATGALQAAAIAARPIPKFKKGTHNAPRGLAIVNEEGPEIIKDKKGNARITQGNLTYLEGGEKIYTHTESKRIVNEMIKQEEINKILQQGMLQSSLANQINQGKRQSRIEELALAMRSGGISKSDMQEVMYGAMKQMTIERNHWDERGYHKSIETINERRRYLNGR